MRRPPPPRAAPDAGGLPRASRAGGLPRASRAGGLPRASRAGLAVVLAVAAAGCATTTRAAAPPPADPEPGDAVVRLVGLDFDPATIQVPAGTRVRWQWTDSVVHNVVSKDFASSRELDGGAHAVRFEQPGTFPYRCTLHAGMNGTVVVTP